jgi:leukotriene-A4 hydrolase
MSAVCISEI